MEKTFSLSILIKIGKEEHIDQLQKKGLIFSKPIKYFREKEVEQFKLRKDDREGASSSIRAKDLVLSIEGKELPFKFINARFNTFDDALNLRHIYCMSYASPEQANGISFIDNRNLYFGEFALIITHPGEFIKRIENSIRNKFKIQYQPVEYYPDNEDYTQLTAFHKPEYFSYQREFRFLFDYQREEDLRFYIGSIEDISLKIKAEQLLLLTMKNI